MPLQALFPTQVYVARLQGSGWQALNRRLLQESLQLREDDGGGRAWSKTHYPGGYTSYGSLCRMHTLSPTFATLGRKLQRHVLKFAAALDFDLDGRELAMTDCWVNVMPRGVTHSLHLHPLSTISGTYYVRTPKGAPGLKFEDPRLDRYMAAPPRKAGHRAENRAWVTVPAAAGNVVLFESWLRHEVPPNPVAAERISISFNFNWF
ncbi:MAG TPA: TIGR02466 family protein [Steroidobacteraceae bacterium]